MMIPESLASQVILSNYNTLAGSHSRSFFCPVCRGVGFVSVRKNLFVYEVGGFGHFRSWLTFLFSKGDIKKSHRMSYHFRSLSRLFIDNKKSVYCTIFLAEKITEEN